MSWITRTIGNLTSFVLASDRGSRTLQIAGIVRFALILLQGVVLVKAGVPLAVVGQVEFVFFVANFLMFFWQNGSQKSLLSWVPEAGDEKTWHRRLGAVFVSMHGFAVIALILLGGVVSFEHLIKSESVLDVWTTLFLGVYIFFTLPTSPIIYNYLLRKKYRRIIGYITVSYTLQILVVLLPVVLGYGISFMVMCLAAFAVARWLFVLVDGAWWEKGLPAISQVFAFVLFALPLIFHALNSGLMDYVDGWIVTGYFGDDKFALYRYGAKELPINALLIGGLLTGLIPKYASAGQIDAADLKKEIRKLIMILFPLSALLILISPILFEIVYSEDFVVSARIFNIYALTLLATAAINQVYLYVHKHNWVLALSTAAEILVNAVLSILLLQKFGLYGIPLATVIAFALHKSFLIIYVQIYLKAPVKDYVPVREYLAGIIGILVCFAIAELIYFY